MAQYSHVWLESSPFQCKPNHGKPRQTDMKMTPVIMMTLRKVRRIRNVPQVQEGSGWILYNLRPYVLYIFGKIMQIPVQWYDPSNQDHHQEDQNDQECPPS